MIFFWISIVLSFAACKMAFLGVFFAHNYLVEGKLYVAVCHITSRDDSLQPAVIQAAVQNPLDLFREGRLRENVGITEHQPPLFHRVIDLLGELHQELFGGKELQKFPSFLFASGRLGDAPR